VAWRRFFVFLATSAAATLTVHFLVWDWTNTSRLLGQLTGLALITMANDVVLQLRRLGQLRERLAVRKGCSAAHDDDAARVLAHVKDDVAAPYRVAPTRPPDRYLAAWVDLLWRRIITSALAVLLFTALWITPMGARVRPSVSLTAMALLLIANLSLGSFLCPNCGKQFRVRATHLNPLRREAWRLNDRPTHCGHCGIAIGSPAPDPIVTRVDQHPEAQYAGDQPAKTRVSAVADPGDALFSGDAGDAADEVSAEAMRGEARGAGGQ
jgi:hypothetical protein